MFGSNRPGSGAGGPFRNLNAPPRHGADVSSFLTHLLIPVLVLAATGAFRLRDVWVWSWPAWINDVDYLGWVFHVKWGWPNVHRALFHNAWLLVAMLLLGWTAWERWHARTRAPWRAFARARPAWILVPFFYASHLVLDLFAGGLTIFWPLSDRSVFWDFTIDFDTSKPIPQPQVVSEPGTYVGVPDVSQIYTWMNAEQFAILVLYLLSLVVMLTRRSPRRWIPAIPLGPTAAPTAPTRRRRTGSRVRGRRPRAPGTG